jgi:3'-phosphoadenosine 5'-phosphosulfate sulfotransferase (PAPS reductase)/FAD synthetase
MENKLKVLVAYSGGKDSLASLIWTIKESGFKKESIEAVFCDTLWEHEETYTHIKETTDALGVKLITLKSKKYDGFVDMSIKKGRFPSTVARFCTEELKTKPMIDYILDECGHVLVIQGIRADESASRSKMEKQCSYFRYYSEPYKYVGKHDRFIKLISDIGIGKKKLTDAVVRKLNKLAPGLLGEEQKEEIRRINKLPENRKPVFHTYRKKDVIEFRKTKSDDVLRPVFEWTGVQVMQYILENGMKPNPLYYKDMVRVGCFPCIMCSKKEIKAIIEHYPEHIQKLRDAEKATGRTFFAPDYIPARYQTGFDPKSQKKIPVIDDVVKYIKDKNSDVDMFEQEEKESNPDRRCMSFYGICE